MAVYSLVGRQPATETPSNVDDSSKVEDNTPILSENPEDVDYNNNATQPTAISIDNLGGIKGVEGSDYWKFNYTISVLAEKNSPGQDINGKAASVRQGSISNQYDESTSVNSTLFIVDIPDLKQSYQIEYLWSSDSNSEHRTNPVSAYCLPLDQLIYGEFSCKDMNTP